MNDTIVEIVNQGTSSVFGMMKGILIFFAIAFVVVIILTLWNWFNR